MVDFDFAAMYEVETRALKQTVKSNSDSFPDDFMFQPSKAEWQEVITKCDNLPKTIKYSSTTGFAFTEQGVAMLSSVLKSKKALQVNIAIMRAFVFIRQYALTHKDLTKKNNELEILYDKQFADVYNAINYLLQKDQKQTEQAEHRRIGFDAEAGK